MENDVCVFSLLNEHGSVRNRVIGQAVRYQNESDSKIDALSSLIDFFLTEVCDEVEF